MAPHWRGAGRAAGRRAGGLRAREHLRPTQRACRLNTAVPVLDSPVPSQLVRPGFPVIGVKNQLAPAGPADFALYKPDVFHAQELSDDLHVTITQTFPFIAERNR